MSRQGTVYKQATVDQRRDLNYIPSVRDWGFPTDIYDADCPACLRGRIHSEAAHETTLQRVREASK